MNVFYLLLNVIPSILCIALSLWLWVRTAHAGFGWFAAAFLVQLVAPFLLMTLLSWIWSGAQYGLAYYLPEFILQHATMILMAIGLWSFRHPIPFPQQRTQPVTFSAINWTTVKRRGVGIIGVGLVCGGIVTIVRGIQYMQMYGGKVSDLGAGPGAIMVGMMCIGLSLHPKSPFQEREKKAIVPENTDENTP